MKDISNETMKNWHLLGIVFAMGLLAGYGASTVFADIKCYGRGLV